MYNVYGHRADQRDDNGNLPSDAQYDAPEYVIYSTDNQLEAEEIVKAGGFIKDEVWHVATRYDDGTGGQFQSEFDRPLNSDPLPENSSAIVKEDGTVETDPSFDPLQKSDIEGILEYEAAATPERGRNDQPGFGGNRKIIP